MAVIRYHTWWPGQSDPYFLYNGSEIRQRVMYYPPHPDGSRYTPYLWVDGTIRAGYGYSNWLTYISNERNVASPLDMQITGNYDSQSRTGDLNIRIIATENITLSNLKLRVALTESNIYFAAPNSSTIHNQTFRDMLPDTLGTPVSIALGETLTYTQPFSCPRPLIEKNCEFVAFVQSDSTRRILQGAKTNLASLEYQIYPFNLLLPKDYENIYSNRPQFIWHQTIDSVAGDSVNYLVCLSTEPTFNSPLFSDTTHDTTWTYPIDLEMYKVYYWKVLAFSEHSLPKESNAIFHFSVQPPCIYVPGDVNGDQTVMWGDLTAGISYFKKSGVVPPDSCYLVSNDKFLYVAGDANGNCEFGGSDITRIVASFRGYTQLIYCLQLPPSE